jgi:hypothetical protein
VPNLFAPDAGLIRNSGVAPETLTVRKFVSTRQRAVDARELTSFEETELSEITELFGNVAHRFSTYAKQGVRNGYPIDVRGAISTQFIEHLTAGESARWLGTTSGPSSPFPRCCHKSITLIVTLC